MTNRSSFKLENKGNVCYFAVTAWLSLTSGCRNPMDIYSSKMESLGKQQRVQRIGEEK